jgi:hypothetical protein
LNTAELIFQSIAALTSPTEIAWIEEKLHADAKGISLAFVMVPRIIAKHSIENELSIITGWNWKNATLDQLVRVYFLLHLAKKEDGKSRIETLFDTAEMNELVALYRALPVLKTPEIWLHRATDAVRSNMGPVFDAIAFGNICLSLSTEEFANVSIGKEVIEMPPTAAAEAFTKSRREKFEFIICLIIELNN